MGGPEKAKAGAREPKIVEAAGLSKDGQPLQAAMEVGLGKVEYQSGRANAAIDESDAGTGKREVETAWKRKL